MRLLGRETGLQGRSTEKTGAATSKALSPQDSFVEVCLNLHRILDPSEVLDVLIEEGCRMLGCRLGLVLWEEGDKAMVRAVGGTDPATLAEFQRFQASDKHQEAIHSLARLKPEEPILLSFPLTGKAEFATVLASMAAMFGSQAVLAAIDSHHGKGFFLALGLTKDPTELGALRSLCQIAASAYDNARIQSLAQSQASELQQLLNLCSELASTANIERFLETFVVRAA